MTGILQVDIKDQPREVAKHLRGVLHRAAKNEVSMSVQLELESRSWDRSGEDAELDAFELVAKSQGITFRSDPMLGIYATPLQDLLQGETNRAILAEYLQREYLSAKFGTEYSTRFLLTTVADDVAANQRPYIDAAIIEAERDELEVPINEIVAVETPIRGRSFQAVRMDYDESDLRSGRVAEGTEIGRAKIQLDETSRHLLKNGVAAEWTYEVERDYGVDKLGFFLRQLTLESEYEHMDDAVEALVSGPGVETINLSTLDPAAAANDVFTLKAIVALSMRFRRGHRMNTVLGRETHMLDFLMTQMGGTTRSLVESGNTPVGALRKLGSPIDGDLSWDAVSGAPAQSLVFFDRNAAIERLTEIGSQISEMESFITSQVRVMTFTESYAYNVIRPTAVKMIDLDA